MGRIFNIYFQHEGHAYSALVTVTGKNDDVKVNTSGGQIQIQLRNGRLSFPISEVLQRVTVGASKGRDESMMHITDSISLQLLNTSW
jgi:hypothetical protein